MDSEFASQNLTAGQLDTIVEKLGGEENARRFLRDELIVREAVLLRKIAEASVSGTDRFVAKDRFKAANVGYAGGNFHKLFLNKVEENVGDAAVVVHRMERSSPNASVLAEFGDQAEIKLAHLFVLLEKQSSGQEGFLLTDGYANVAYVRDTTGTLWAVCASWDIDHNFWRVTASSVEDPIGRGVGAQVLSRDS